MADPIEKRRLRVEPAAAGERLDSYLARNAEGLSRMQAEAR